MELPRYRTFKFTNGQVVKNRVVVPPMASQTADERGYVTAATIAHYARLASSGAGTEKAELIQTTFSNEQFFNEKSKISSFI